MHYKNSHKAAEANNMKNCRAVILTSVN